MESNTPITVLNRELRRIYSEINSRKLRVQEDESVINHLEIEKVLIERAIELEIKRLVI